MRPDKPDQAGQRTFRVCKLKHSYHAQEFLLTGAASYSFSDRNGYGGELPVKYSDLGVDAREQGVS